MNHPGVFYSYRTWRGLYGRIQLGVYELEGRVPSRMEVYQGAAPDNYAPMQVFPDQSLILLIMADTNSVVVQTSSDGVNWTDEIEVDPQKRYGSTFYHRYAARGFRVKNLIPGAVGNYQIGWFA
jgi:hypothetical protein